MDYHVSPLPGCGRAEAGVCKTLQSILGAFHSHMWFRMDNDHQIMADLLWTITFRHFLDVVEQKLASAKLSLPSAPRLSSLEIELLPDQCAGQSRPCGPKSPGCARQWAPHWQCAAETTCNRQKLCRGRPYTLRSGGNEPKTGEASPRELPNSHWPQHVLRIEAARHRHGRTALLWPEKCCGPSCRGSSW